MHAEIERTPSRPVAEWLASQWAAKLPRSGTEARVGVGYLHGHRDRIRVMSITSKRAPLRPQPLYPAPMACLPRPNVPSR